MVAQTFFSETCLEDLKKLLRWVDGKVVWAFPFWLWGIKRGLCVTDYDTIPYEIWASDGFSALNGHISAECYNLLAQNTVDNDLYASEIKELFASRAFRYIQQLPKPDDIIQALDEGAVCEAVVDSCALNQVAGTSLHRIVIFDTYEDGLIVHDPSNPDQEAHPYRKIDWTSFLRAWPSQAAGEDSAELCVYKRQG